MRLHHRYRIIIEDEETLENKLNFSGRLLLYIIVLCGFLLIAVGIGILILAATPMKSYLPGYLKDSERAATEIQHLRLDSLLEVVERNDAYLKNIQSVLFPNDPDSTAQVIVASTNPVEFDSLLQISEEEKNFIEGIRERDKYSIVASSTAAAEPLMFESPNESGVITEATENSYVANIVLPVGGNVSAIADGKVISVSQSPQNYGAYEIIIQHPNGFISKSSRLGTLFVNTGDRVSAGQIIAVSKAGSSRQKNLITFELWHDGNQLIPSRYIMKNERK
ncbi:MAG: M23 family metallopeptidase [Muribaculaceae bacterium]|nr:M23 family metallopeptidase [Muribaculaceae bacterium]